MTEDFCKKLLLKMFFPLEIWQKKPRETEIRKRVLQKIVSEGRKCTEI